MDRNRVSKILKIEYPIIQAPMNWITSAELVAAVSNAGGLGTLGPNAGIVALDSTVRAIESLRKEITRTRELTEKSFAVNFLITNEPEIDTYNRALLNMFIEEKVKIIAAVGDANAKQISELKELGFTLIFRELTPTVTGAKTAEKAGADIIGATGFDAGGFTPKNAVGTMVIIPILADSVDIPIVAVGGIADKRTVNASFALGAEGVYLGTRFIASLESPVSNITKQNIVKYNTEDMLLYHTTYSYNRATPNKLALELKNMELAGASGQEIDQKMYAQGGLKSGMLEGDTNIGIDSYSSSIGLINKIKSCREIIEELMADVKATAENDPKIF